MKRIITISREFGSGGRTIGRMAAKQLGISFYDKELIEKVAGETGYAEKFIEEQGEDAPAQNSFAYSFVGRGINGMSVNDYLWTAQMKIIQELADKESCVIVGRCADYILKERQDCLHVFIHASQEKKAERIVRIYGETKEKPEKRLREKDRRRSINYKYYTGQNWGMAQNCHLSLDSGEFGLEVCTDMITRLFKTTL